MSGSSSYRETIWSDEFYERNRWLEGENPSSLLPRFLLLHTRHRRRPTRFARRAPPPNLSERGRRWGEVRGTGIGDVRGQGGEAERGRGDRDDVRGGQGKARGDGAKREGTRDNLAPKRQRGRGRCAVPQTSRHKGRVGCDHGEPTYLAGYTIFCLCDSICIPRVRMSFLY